VFVAVSAIVIVVTLTAAALTWLLSASGNQTSNRSVLNQAPFAQAIAALAAAPEVHYRTSIPELGTVDVRATSTGELVGTAEQDGQPVQMLRVGGRVYVKSPESALPTGDNPAESSAMDGKWLTGSAVSKMLGSLPDQFVPPEQLASLLAGALSTAEPLPATVIDGQPVVAANTRLGTLYVTRNQPYRVVRLVPAASSGSTTQPAGSRPAGVTGAGSTTDFPAEQPGDVSSTYAQLKLVVPELASAIDTDLNFRLQGNGQVSCSEAGCQVTVTVTNSISPSQANTGITGGTVNADLSADVTIDGQPAGGCTGAGPLPLNGTGTMSCSVPSAAGVFNATKAQKAAEAEQQSEAEGGVPVPYSISFGGDFFVYATAQVNVEELADKVNQDADNAVTLYKAPGKGMTQKLLDQGFQPEDFPGDPRSNGYPDGRAYFGLHDRGKDIALDYAGRGGYDSKVIEVIIPLDEFQRYFGNDVSAYDGVPAAQVAIPNTSFDILNRYPRTLVP
jgi:hypothetical protein